MQNNPTTIEPTILATSELVPCVCRDVSDTHDFTVWEDQTLTSMDRYSRLNCEDNPKEFVWLNLESMRELYSLFQDPKVQAMLAGTYQLVDEDAEWITAIVDAWTDTHDFGVLEDGHLDIMDFYSRCHGHENDPKEFVSLDVPSMRVLFGLLSEPAVQAMIAEEVK